MFSYFPPRERRANTLYRIFLNLSQEQRDRIATAILMGGQHQAVNIYGSVVTRAVAHYHPALKHRGSLPDWTQVE